MTHILDTLAIGHGTIVDIGASAVTEHGHCWAATIDPTTSDDKTTNGAGSVGVFESTLTELSPLQKYYVRAYATNTEGTSYGANVTFTADQSNTQLLPFEISVVETRLHYVDVDGKERYLEGTLV